MQEEQNIELMVPPEIEIMAAQEKLIMAYEKIIKLLEERNHYGKEERCR